jgi:hypothetical protein
MRLRPIRFLTAILVAGACAWTAVQGLGFVRFTAALESGVIDDGWTATPGLASLALDAQLRAAADRTEPDALRRREDRLGRLLAIKPGASRAWLSLAAARDGVNAPQDKIDAAFVMSGVTGPAEGALMLDRALLGILLWEKASRDVHARTLTDLCGLPAFDPWKIRLVMTTKSAPVRADIRAGLDANGCSPATIKTVGL